MEECHYVDPLLDITSSPYTKHDKGKIVARQYHAVRALQNPNDGLFT